MKKYVVLVGLTLMLIAMSACGASEEEVGIAARETQESWTPVPSQTPLPTHTPYPTLTPMPTFTPYPTPTPLPTYTPLPTFTPPPSPTPLPEKELLFEETFEDKSTCFKIDDLADRGEMYVQDGSLIIDVQASSYDDFLPIWTFCEGQTLADFSLEVEATQIGGSVDNAFGVLFRGVDDIAYSFLVSSDGYYCLTLLDYKPAGEDWSLLGCWTPIAEIRRGNQTNLLGVVADEATIELYINEVLVGHVRDINLFSGEIGFAALVYDDKGTTISFDNLKVTTP